MSHTFIASDLRTSSPKTVNTTCCYCGVGCGVTATVENNQVIAVKGDEKHPANFGRLCVKGSSLHETQNSADRLLRPLLNNQTVSWDDAMAFSVGKFRQIIDEHGPDAVAFYLSGQLLTEDYYVANKLMKGFIGSANVDTNSRLCMAAATVAHKRAFGGDVVPGCYEDLEQADLLLIVGSNMAYAHPITYQRIVKAKQQRPNMKVVVIDPRRTATCDAADLHLALRPGSDAFLFNGLLSYLAQHDALDRGFIAQNCEGFDAALDAATGQVPTLDQAATFCDLPKAELEQVYSWFAHTEKVVTVFSQGINQSSSGVDKGNAIINCHLATGKIGKVGAAPFSITGQPNAMGGREVGGLANQLAAHMSFDKPDDIDRVARFWKAENMAQREGRKAVDMFQDVHDGKIKAIWIMATNPAATMPNANLIRAALQRAELVIVSDCIANTDTASLAHVVFPATTWGEKIGTVTNSERRISLQKGMVTAPGEARHDWQILSEFARRLGFGEAFDYQHPAQIFREHAALSGFENDGQRAFDISAFADISNQQYENFQPVQWPVNAANPQGRARLFEQGRFYTKSGRAALVAVSARFPQMPAKAGQVIMNTGRIRDQWHTMGRTGNAAKLFGHCDEPFVDMHPDDMRRLNLAEGALVELENQNARYLGRAQANAGQRPGEVFAPMHWNARFASSSCADALVNAFTDPLCGQPEFKHSPVKIKAYEAQWRGFVLLAPGLAPDLAKRMATDYWVKIIVPNGVKYRQAHTQVPEHFGPWLKAFFPEIEDWAELQDSAQNFYRVAGFIDGKLKLLFHAKTGVAAFHEHPWLEQQLDTECDRNTRFALLAGKPAAGIEDTGKIICSCYQVGENTIRKAINQGCNSATALGEKLKCGTNCGSCIPELNGLIGEALVVRTA